MPCTGVTFAAELIMSWNVAFVATRNLRKRIVLKRRKIAHFYIWHGTFIFDTISTLVFIIQVLLLLLKAVGRLVHHSVAYSLHILCLCCRLHSIHVQTRKSFTACEQALVTARANKKGCIALC